MFWALKPAVVALVLHAAWQLGRRTLHHSALAVIAALAFLGLTVLHLPFPALIAAAGFLLARRWPQWFSRPAAISGTTASSSSSSSSAADSAPAIHDDNTPTPAPGSPELVGRLGGTGPVAASGQLQPGCTWDCGGLLSWGGAATLAG